MGECRCWWENFEGAGYGWGRIWKEGNGKRLSQKSFIRSRVEWDYVFGMLIELFLWYMQKGIDEYLMEICLHCEEILIIAKVHWMPYEWMKMDMNALCVRCDDLVRDFEIVNVWWMSWNEWRFGYECFIY